MRKEFINISIEIINVKEDVILYSGIINNNVEGLQDDDDLMSEN